MAARTASSHTFLTTLTLLELQRTCGMPARLRVAHAPEMHSYANHANIAAAVRGATAALPVGTCVQYRARRGPHSIPCKAAATEAAVAQKEPTVAVKTWHWRDYDIRYQTCGQKGPPVILVHGFCASSDHWRKNTPALGAQGYRVYAIDLLGYGFSDKPDPKMAPRHSIYNFTTWGQQLTNFIEQVAGEPAIIVCHSAGGLVGLEASVDRPDLIPAVQLINLSFRRLHVARLPAWRVVLVKAFQWLLHDTPFGRVLFRIMANPKTVRKILRQAYGRKEAVTDELVECILKPGLLSGAPDVFLESVSYSEGPLPEELLASTTRPVEIVWGEADPWQSADLARIYFSHLPSVKQFITLPGVGHCPQDEAPELVNPLIDKFCKVYSAAGMSKAQDGLRSSMTV